MPERGSPARTAPSGGVRVLKWPDRSLRFYMLVAAAMLLAPLLLVGFFTTAYYASSERQRLEDFAESATEVAALAFDAEIELYRAALRALAVSPNVAGLSVAELQDRAEALFSEHGTELSIISYPRGNYPTGAAESRLGSSGYFEQIQEASPTESSGSDGRSLNGMFVLEAELHDETQRLSVLRARIPVARLSRYLERIKPQKGSYSIFVYDSAGSLVVRSDEGDALSSDLVQQILASDEKGGRVRGVGPDGSEYVAFWYHLPNSQRHLVLSIGEDVLTEPLSDSLAILLAVGSFLILIGMIGATILGQIMKVSQDRLLAAASAVGHGRRIEPFRTPLREINVVGQVLADASVRLEKSAQELLSANERLERRIRVRTRELYQKSSLLKATLDSVDQAIVHFDDYGEILLANRHSDEVFSDWSADGVTPRALAEVVPSGSARVTSAAPGSDSADNRPAERDDPVVIERQLPDGTILEIRKIALADGSTVCSFLDISSRVRHAEMLEQAKVAAEDANRAKDDFLANMSHELRTPLNAVLGYADLMMLDASLSETNQERVRRLRGAGWGLLAVLNDVLDYSRIEAGTLPMECVSFDLLDVIHDAVSIIQPMADDKKLALDVDVDDMLPSRLIGDPTRIRQILINLLSNAVKFTDVGFVRLSVQGRVSEDAGTVSLKIAVEDSGIGIPHDQQGAVFERFHQVRRSNDTLYRGTGLGLAICRQLVTRMGGKIWLRSSTQIGTMFTFALVLAVDWQAAPTRASEIGQRRQPIRILLADDVEISRDVIAELLQVAGVEVDCVSDGMQAVEAVGARAYDLVILDINMPLMDGYEAARRIRANDANSHIPIIACSASPLPEDINRFRESSYDEYLAKPLDVRAIQFMLERNLPLHARPVASPTDARKPSQAAEGEVRALTEMLGPVRVKAGLDVLARQLDELLQIDVTDRVQAGRISGIAHSGLTSARLFGLDNLVDLLVRLEAPSMDGEDLFQMLMASQPQLQGMHAQVVSLGEDVVKRLDA